MTLAILVWFILVLCMYMRVCGNRMYVCVCSNRTTWRSPDDRKKTQTAVVWSCFPFIRSGQNHLARHSERRKKTRQTEEEVGRQHQGMDRPGVRQVPEGDWEQGKMEKTGCKIICGAPTTLVVKGLMMIDDNEHHRILGSWKYFSKWRMWKSWLCLMKGISEVSFSVGTTLFHCVIRSKHTSRYEWAPDLLKGQGQTRCQFSVKKEPNQRKNGLFYDKTMQREKRWLTKCTACMLSTRPTSERDFVNLK